MRVAYLLPAVLLSSLISVDAYSEDRPICNKKGNVKNWAKKAGYTQEYCDQNTAPTVTITSLPKRSTVEEGTQIDLSATASDNEDGDLSDRIIWRSSRDGVITSTSTLSVGKHRIIARVKDRGGLKAKDRIIVKVVATEEEVNSAPSVAIDSPIKGTSLEEGTQITLSGTATDKEDGDLSNLIVWESSLDGTLNTTPTLSVGNHIITASISDNAGLTAKTQTSVTITEAAPSMATVTLSWIMPDTRENGESLELYEIGGYEIMYKKSGDELYFSETINDSNTTDHVLEELEPGEYEFKVAAFDTDGLYSRYTVQTFTVE